MPETIPIACSLEQAELPDRAETMALLGRDLVAVHASGQKATLIFTTEPENVEQFVRDESRCCPFFDFGVSTGEGRVTLAVSAPEDGAWAVRGLVAGFVAAWGGLV